jgi:GT2 family glycosyltransferase
MKVSIIVPTRQLKREKNFKFFYKPVTSLVDLLPSIRNNVKIEHEVIVVCNGVNDKNLVDYVSKSNLIDKYCVLNKNSGVSRAWNIGRMMAEGEALVFVNDDVTIGVNAIESLYQYMMHNDNIGEIGPKGALWNNAEHKCFVGDKYPEQADAVAGFCFMTKATVFDEVGGIDINYTPAGFEEIDYSFKVRKAGYKCMVLPNLEIKTEPNHGISAQNTDIKYFDNTINTKILHEKNKTYFLSKWYNNQ